MKRKVSLLVSFAVVGAIALVRWFGHGAPPAIPYEAWYVPGDPVLPLWKTTDATLKEAVPPDRILQSASFSFTMGVGSGMQGLDVFHVDHAGQAVYVFRTSVNDWWRVDLQVSPRLLARLRKLLVDVEYPSLKRAYHATAVDGSQWCIRLEVDGISKKVYCDNYFPGAAERLGRFVADEILPSHHDEIMRARRIGQSAARKLAAELW